MLSTIIGVQIEAISRPGPGMQEEGVSTRSSENRLYHGRLIGELPERRIDQSDIHHSLHDLTHERNRDPHIYKGVDLSISPAREINQVE